MIFTELLIIIVSILNILFSFLPHVTMLPFGMDAALVTAFGSWYGFLQVFWPLQIVWTMVLWYYGVLVTLIGLKFLLGHRIY